MERLEKLTDEEFVEMVKIKRRIDYNNGDIVWIKDKDIRESYDRHKYEVLSFEPARLLCSKERPDTYLTVKLRNIITGHLSSYLTSHLKKCRRGS